KIERGYRVIILKNAQLDIHPVLNDCRRHGACYRIVVIPLLGRGAMLRGLDPWRQLLLERENPRTLFGKTWQQNGG
ncbi:hypothetical protein NGC32_07820, partial [Kluyvera cryocrescens]|uniref:hypothetical protein n=1 Tax=Kluyvera cryocrescens TaxID=580 RepID=UPI002DBEC506